MGELNVLGKESSRKTCITLGFPTLSRVKMPHLGLMFLSIKLGKQISKFSPINTLILHQSNSNLLLNLRSGKLYLTYIYNWWAWILRPRYRSIFKVLIKLKPKYLKNDFFLHIYKICKIESIGGANPKEQLEIVILIRLNHVVVQLVYWYVLVQSEIYILVWSNIQNLGFIIIVKFKTRIYKTIRIVHTKWFFLV